MEKSSMPPGFWFNPTDVELVQYYLKRKIMGKRIHVKVVAEVDIYKWAPWDLPGQSYWQGGDLKWYFFCPREKKYAKGGRLNRATGCGYWKTTGKDRSVLYNSEVVGWIKTLIFHTGRAPSGERTNWVLHEYRLEDKNLVDKGVAQDSYVLCIVFQKDGIGPRNNKQYGAPFNEEDWTDDEVETDVVALVNMTEPNLVHTNMLEPEPNLTHSQILEIDTVQANIHEQAFVNTNIYEPYLVNSNMPEPYPVYPNLPQPDFCFANMSEPFLSQPSNYNSSITRTNSSESCASDVLPPSTATLQPGPSNYIATDPVSPDNDILSMLDAFTEEDKFSMDVSYQTKGLDNLNCSGDACPMADVGRLDDTDKYLGGSSKAGYSFPCGAISEVPIVNEPYLELFDLDKPLGGDNYLFPMISPPRTLGGETPYEEDLFFPWRDEL